MCDDDYWWYWYCDNSTPEETAEAWALIFKSYLFGFPAGVIGYEIGKIIYDVNLVKWGLTVVFLFFAVKFIGQFVSFLVYAILSKFDYEFMEVLLRMFLFIVIGIATSYLIAQFGRVILVNDGNLVKYIAIYEGLFHWLINK